MYPKGYISSAQTSSQFRLTSGQAPSHPNSKSPPRQRRSNQRRPVIPIDTPKALAAGFPIALRLRDLRLAVPDEIPPDQYLLGARRTAKQNDPAAGIQLEAQCRVAAAQVGQFID